MSERKLIVLGTASQVPSRERNQNGYFLRFDEQGFLFDPGEGTQRQMILGGVAVSGITKIFISHFHGDHCLGLAGIIQRISLDKVPHEIEVYYPASGQVFYERLKDSCSYHHEGRLVERPIRDEGVVFEDDRMVISAARLDHDIETFGFRFQEKDSYTLDPEMLCKTGIFGAMAGELKKTGRVRVKSQVVTLDDVGTLRPGQIFAYVMDTRLCDAISGLVRDADMLLMEATFLSDLEDKAREFGHLTAAQAGTIARDSGVNLLVLTHYSQRYPSPEPFVEEASRFHENTVAARDGQAIDMPRRTRSLQMKGC
jgi:ribonuclease Z